MILSSPKSLFTVEPSSASSSPSRTSFGNLFPSLPRFCSWQRPSNSPQTPFPLDYKRGFICPSTYRRRRMSSCSDDSPRQLPSTTPTSPSWEPTLSPPAEASPDWKYATQGLSLSLSPHFLLHCFLVLMVTQPANTSNVGQKQNRPPSALNLHIGSADQPATCPPTLYPQYNIPSPSSSPRPIPHRVLLPPIRPPTISFLTYHHLNYHTITTTTTTTTAAAVSPSPHPSFNHNPALPRYPAIVTVYQSPAADCI